MNHKNHPKPIELCGRFTNWRHFARFRAVEEYRGWFLVPNSITVLNEADADQADHGNNKTRADNLS